MPTFEFTSPDGKTYLVDGPDGSTKEQAYAILQKNISGNKSEKPDENSFFKNVAIGIGKGMTDVALGARQALDDSAAYLERKFGGQAINSALGMKSAADIQKETQAAVNEKRLIDADIMATGGGKVGSVIGTAAPAVVASVIPGMQGFAGTVATGAALGGMEPVATGESRLSHAALGAAGGAAGYGLAKGLAKVISPEASRSANLQLLKDEGVEPTIGQALGGFANSLEQKLTSTPILGDAISAARMRALHQFDNAAINRSTEPIGKSISGTGQSAVKEAGDALSVAYDDALNQVQHVTLDNQFANDLTQLYGLSQNLVPTMRGKFNRTLDDIVLSRVSPQGSMLGTTYKTIDSELGGIASRFQKSSGAGESEFGDAVAQLKNLLNQNMQRSNPHVAETLNKIDEGWANLVRVEAAAKSGMNAQGVFTPAQLNTAIRMSDDSTRGRSVSRGTALMQDLGNAGQAVLGNTVADSGTAGRAMAGIGALGTGFLHPAIPLSLIGGAGVYSRPMQQILTKLASDRPQSAVPLAAAVSDAAAQSGAIGASLMGLANESNLLEKTARQLQIDSERAKIDALRLKNQIEKAHRQQSLRDISGAKTADEAIDAFNRSIQ